MAVHAVLTGVLDFRINGNPTVFYTNPQGDGADALTLSMRVGTFDFASRQIPKSGTEYTYTLTDSERASLRSLASGDHLTVTFILAETLGGTQYTDEKTAVMRVIEELPSVTALECLRCDTQGDRDPSGTRIYLHATMDYLTASCQMRWRSRTESELGFGDWNVLTTTNDEFYGILSGTFATSSAHVIQLGVVDLDGASSNIELRIPASDVTVHLGEGGKALGIGTYADTDNKVKVAWETTFLAGFNGTHANETASDPLAFAESCDDGLTPFATSAKTGIVRKFGSRIAVYMTDYSTGEINVNIYNGGSWSGWKTITPQ